MLCCLSSCHTSSRPRRFIAHLRGALETLNPKPVTPNPKPVNPTYLILRRAPVPRLSNVSNPTPMHLDEVMVANRARAPGRCRAFTLNLRPDMKYTMKISGPEAPGPNCFPLSHSKHLEAIEASKLGGLWHLIWRNASDESPKSPSLQQGSND